MLNRSILAVAVFASLAAPSFAAEVELRKTACRLLDTRQIGGFNAGSKVSSMTIETQAASLGTVSFTHNGRDYNPQGGESGCKVPRYASGAILNFVVFQPDSVGSATLWPAGLSQPLSTSINSSGSLNEATGLPVTLGTSGQLSLAATITGAHYIADLAGAVIPCVPDRTFDFSYSSSQSSISVPETGDIDLLKYADGTSIWVGGSASQPGLYTITGSAISNGRQRLYVTPTPQAATDIALEVHLLPGACSPRDIKEQGGS